MERIEDPIRHAALIFLGEMALYYQTDLVEAAAENTFAYMLGQFADVVFPDVDPDDAIKYAMKHSNVIAAGRRGLQKFLSEMVQVIQDVAEETEEQEVEVPDVFKDFLSDGESDSEVD